VSQSGETADTLATLRYAKEHKQHALAVVNVPTSTIARESDAVARQGKIILITDPQGAHDVHLDSLSTLTLPAMPATVTPLVYAIPVQLIAYHSAVVIWAPTWISRETSPSRSRWSD
jgi:glucosamine 6-phosphate synthetase-like amidotransferase/phosphosugar isomerase protein